MQSFIIIEMNTPNSAKKQNIVTPFIELSLASHPKI